MQLRVLEDLVLFFDLLWLSAVYMIIKTVILLVITRPKKLRTWEWVLIGTTAVLFVASAFAAIVYSHVPSFWARAQLGRIVIVTILTLVASALVSDLASAPLEKHRAGVVFEASDYIKTGVAAAVLAFGVVFFWCETVDFVAMLTKK